MTPDGPQPTLRGERVELRPAEAGDAEALAGILAEPEVRRWWGEPYTVEETRKVLPGTLVIVVGGAVAGWLHVDEETDPDYPSVAFDIMLTARLHGRGYGREALRVAIRHFSERGHHRFTIDPAVDNEPAIRSYVAVGFKPVGVLRSAERAPGGGWRDCLLLDLLAGELAPEGG